MRPTSDALQVFYRTIPLILVIVGYYTREQMLLKDILERLRKLEAKITEELPKIRERLTTLESRAGIIYHE